MARRPENRKPKVKQVVCKPCWELKYCPYGPLVEFFPLHPEGETITAARKMHRRAREMLKSAHRESDVMRGVEFFLYSSPHQWEWILPTNNSFTRPPTSP